MKAIKFDRYGPPEVLHLTEMPTPEPEHNEVLIRIHATTVSYAETAMRRSEMLIGRIFTGLLRPKIKVGGDVVAGEIVGIGSAVTRIKTGDKVFGIAGMSQGAFAEYIALPEDGGLIPLPGGVSYSDAAAATDGLLTALPFLRDAGKVKPGQKVLINGASGSIGTIAVQLAKHFGAHVTGVTSTKNLELVKSLGADEVIDYTQRDYSANTEAYDIIFDTVGKSSFKASRSALKQGGIYLTTVPSWAILRTMLFGSKTGKCGKLVTAGLRPLEVKVKDLVFLGELLAAGKLKPVIGRRYPLADMVKAQAYVETERKVGALVIDTVASPLAIGSKAA